MIIAVSLSVLQKSAYPETCDSLSQDWVRFLIGLRVEPLLVPNGLADPAQYCRQMNVQGILLTSGNDIGPQPGEEWLPSGSVAQDRDRTEEALIQYSVSSGIPLMGICRGMQFTNTYFGGTLVRDLARWTQGEKHVASYHRVKIVDPSFRDRLGVDALSTNSFHNQGVTEETLAPGLKVIAKSDAGVVEALYHPELPLLGIQWHPERKNPDPRLGAALLHHWLDWCGDRSRVYLPDATA